MNDFKKELDNAIDMITKLQSGMTIRVRGRVVEVKLPLEIAKILKKSQPPRTSKKIDDGSIGMFYGLPCEVKANIDKVQYVIEGDVIYEKIWWKANKETP